VRPVVVQEGLQVKQHGRWCGPIYGQMGTKTASQVYRRLAPGSRSTVRRRPVGQPILAARTRTPERARRRPDARKKFMLESYSLVERNGPLKTMVTVAQLVESRIVIPVVVGSSPIGHPKNSLQHKDLRHSDQWRFFFLSLA